MFHKPVSGLAGIVFLVVCASVAVAQNFHVETQIDDLQARTKTGKPLSVGAAESLFHAGKVYDHNRGLNEMTIYEPALERFVIIDKGRNLKTEISFTEITDHLIEDHAAARDWVSDPEKYSLTSERVAFLKFQLNPQFKTSFTSPGGVPTLVMSSPLVEYKIECAPETPPAQVQAYLDYADWAARLSFVTRRQAMLPDVRLAVNAELRKRKLLPVKVTLLTRVEKGIHYRAEHKFLWELNGFDKTEISRWDAKAADPALKTLPWLKYFKSFAQADKQTAKRK
jgi:hypothetical protein